MKLLHRLTLLLFVLLLVQYAWGKLQLPKPTDTQSTNSISTSAPAPHAYLQPLLPGQKRSIVTNEPQLHVIVLGVEDPAKKNVINSLQHLQNQLEYPLDAEMIDLFKRKAPYVIEKALEPYGFFRPRIAQHTTYIYPHWTTTFDIDPGPEMKVSAVDIKISGPGADDPEFHKLLENFPLQVGHPLNVDAYNQTKIALASAATDTGYFAAQMVTSKLIINLYTYTAQIILHYTTGPRFRIGVTTFSPTPFATSFLVRFLRYREGDYFSNRDIQDTQQDLIKSNYFDTVIITPMTEFAVNDIVPIDIHLIPRKSKQYTIGFGYGTDTGIQGILGVTFRHLNAYGHRFSTLIQASSVNNSLLATYTIPGIHPATDQYAISAGIAHMNENIGTSNSQKVALSYTQGLGDYLLQTIALTALDERYNLLTLPAPIQNIQAELLYPSIQWSFLTYDNPAQPNQGLSINALITGTPNQLSSTDQGGFSQYRVNAKLLTTLGFGPRILARASYGQTVIKNIQNLPLSLQLLAGGADSIRGFGYNDIGPGRTLVIGSFEAQVPVKKNWFLAGFVDAGSVSNNAPWNTLDVGVGPGIVWLSPVGYLELSFAKPVKIFNPPGAPPLSRSWMVQFSMGPAL